MDYRDLVERARSRISEISPEQLERDLHAFVVLDIREREEYALGTIDGARSLPRGVLERDIAAAVPDRGAKLALVCAAGDRSALAAESIAEMGYRNVVSVAGGYRRWFDEGRRSFRPEALSTEQRVRYDRHLRLDEIGEPGQHRLMSARAVVIGAGGLGSPALLYLAAAGVGTIGIVDGDRVDTSNLQRQVVHGTGDVGRLKVESARSRVLEVNPDVKVEIHPMRLEAQNAMEILSGYDVIVDGADNFPTRYLINDAAVRLRLPVVHGSVLRFEGQVTVFVPYEGPCYRCLFPLPPPAELAPSCADAGVLGSLPGIIGSIQAVEATKVLLGIGTGLMGRLLVADTLDETWRELVVETDPACPACGDPERPPALVDYDAGCAPR